jgi:hypothetical protein
MAIREYIGEGWRGTLRHNHADGFEQLWARDADNWFEPPNHRRGGWSGVVRTKLALPEGGEVGIFIKRQENHIYRAWQNLFRPVATFEREFRNLLRFRQLGIATLELVYFGQQRRDGNLRAILLTRELQGFLPLNAASLQASLKTDPDFRKRLILRLADVIRRMHDVHMQHNCLYPKHIFVKKLPDNAIDVRLIDLEKAKWRPLRKQAMLRDLESLQRHAQGWSKTDRLRLFLAYRQEQQLNTQSKRILLMILQSHKKPDKS